MLRRPGAGVQATGGGTSMASREVRAFQRRVRSQRRRHRLRRTRIGTRRKFDRRLRRRIGIRTRVWRGLHVTSLTSRVCPRTSGAGAWLPAPITNTSSGHQISAAIPPPSRRAASPQSAHGNNREDIYRAQDPDRSRGRHRPGRPWNNRRIGCIGGSGQFAGAGVCRAAGRTGIAARAVRPRAMSAGNGMRGASTTDPITAIIAITETPTTAADFSRAWRLFASLRWRSSLWRTNEEASCPPFSVAAAC